MDAVHDNNVQVYTLHAGDDTRVDETVPCTSMVMHRCARAVDRWMVMMGTPGRLHVLAGTVRTSSSVSSSTWTPSMAAYAGGLVADAPTARTQTLFDECTNGTNVHAFTAIH